MQIFVLGGYFKSKTCYLGDNMTFWAVELLLFDIFGQLNKILK